MAKAILLVRVSTTKQEIEAQKNELIQLANNDGYKNNNLIIIEGVGASAIKLNDIYLQEMEELYNTISTENISAVYAWEISRIGRNEEILMKFKNFLIERKVQLVIKNPSLRLLNNDGTVNTGVELAFSLFATMSKQEMEIKKERFKRSKERNKLEGKFNGGIVKFGYALDSTNHMIPHPVNADIVRNCFDLYVNQGKTLKYIHNYLASQGVAKEIYKYNQSGWKARKIIKDICYTGVNYPALISKEIYEKAQIQINQNIDNRETKNVLYCKGLIKEKTTNKTLVAAMGVISYKLQIPNIQMYLNINALDSVAWYYAQILHGVYTSKDTEKTKREYEEKIQENNTIIQDLQHKTDTIQKAIKRAIRLNIEQPEHFTSDDLNDLIKEKETEIAHYKRQITDIEIDNVRMNNFITGTEKDILVFGPNPSDEKKREIINTVIEKIQVEQLARAEYKLIVFNKVGMSDTSYFSYKTSGHDVKVYHVMHNGAKIEIPITIRYKRKRYEKKQ